MFESALIIEVPEAEVAVERWRSMLDPVSGVGVPAHITIVYPFVERVSDKALLGIKEIAASVRPFTYMLESVARWPGVLYLPPVPAGPFLDLTRRCLERWPHLQPYSGEFDDIVPHLTVAQKKDGPFDEHLAATIIEDVGTHLPVEARAETVSLWVTDGGAWTAHTTFPLGGGSKPGP